jgi:hypothetical protein
MTNQTCLIYPTLNLFLYDLREGLGQNEQEIELNFLHFWQKIYSESLDIKSEHFHKLQQAEQDSYEYVELLAPRKVEVFPYPLGLDGYYYPVKLGDTYGLQVNCTATDMSVDKYSPLNIACLSKVQNSILEQINDQKPELKPKIGQTWLVWGQLAADNQDILKTAQQCYEQLKLPNKQEWNENKLIINKGSFLGGTVFELWRLPSQWEKNDGYHILICLFPNYLKLNNIQSVNRKFYPLLIRLLGYRHKILWAYSQSRILKANLKQGAKLVNKTVNNLNNSLKQESIPIKQIQKTLVETPGLLLAYTNNLSFLDDQRRTIKINLGNYNKRWQKFLELDSNSDWSFCNIFSEFTQEKFLEQIEADQSNLTPGLALIENTIKTVQGVIDIQKSEKERQLNQTIGIAGVGLASSQIATAVILAQQPNDYREHLGFRFSVFGWSLFIGLLFAALAYAFLRILRGK